MFGAGVSMVLFTGVFLYAIYSFKEWSVRDSLPKEQEVQKTKEPV
jgi:hypothetical protein